MNAAENQPIKYLDPETAGVCQRCKTETAILISRKDRFCSNCFVRFIRGKQRKQMLDDRYKVKYGKQADLATQKILLTVSGGVSSLVLVDVIGSLLQEQAVSHQGKQGFELVLLNIDEFNLNLLDKKVLEILPGLLERFAPVTIEYKILSLDSYILDQSMLLKIVINNEFSGLSSELSDNRTYTLIDLLSLCPNKSSIEDLLTIIYDELIIRTAVLEGCETVLYGHSMTRIANEIIALTVKGRGSTVYKAIADHTVLLRGSDVKILYPLRDVLFAEIVAYANLTDLNQYQVASTVAKSKITKNMTIRDLTTNYFSMLDATGYASTAFTVVKTGEKLGAPQAQVLANCQVCGVEIFQDPREWLRRITVNDAAPIETDEERNFSEMYKAAVVKVQEVSDNAQHVHICYGCIVSLGGTKQESGFVWPLQSGTEGSALRNTYVETQKVLDEFALTDDEE